MILGPDWHSHKMDQFDTPSEKAHNWQLSHKKGPDYEYAVIFYIIVLVLEIEASVSLLFWPTLCVEDPYIMEFFKNICMLEK